MKLYYLGFRMQPLHVRRGMSLIAQVGLLWTEVNPEMLARVMRGEKLDLGIDLRTKEISPAHHETPETKGASQS
jgi:hypothetical protein